MSERVNLNDFYLQVFFGRVAPPETFELVLRSRGKEITTTSGYARVSVSPKAWRVGSGEAALEARFGPFPAGAEFDETAILADGVEIHTEPMPGRIPPTGDFTWTPNLVVV